MAYAIWNCRCLHPSDSIVDGFVWREILEVFKFPDPTWRDRLLHDLRCGIEDPEVCRQQSRLGDSSDTNVLDRSGPVRHRCLLRPKP